MPEKPSLDNPADGVTVDPVTKVQKVSWEGVEPGDEPDGPIYPGFPVGQ